jgi:hypothetical protein
MKIKIPTLDVCVYKRLLFCLLFPIGLHFCSSHILATEFACCGDISYDTSIEECCDGWVVLLGQCCAGYPLGPEEVCCEETAVSPDKCCNEKLLGEGEACCYITADPYEQVYTKDTECCVQDVLIGEVYVKNKYGITDYTDCPDRVQLKDYWGWGDQICSNPVLREPYRDNPSLLPASSPCTEETTSFLRACQIHDQCFGNCQPPPADTAFDQCNSDFYNNMADSCYASSEPGCEAHCLQWADVYRKMVSLPGRAFAFDAGQNQSCQCCADE